MDDWRDVVIESYRDVKRGLPVYDARNHTFLGFELDLGIPVHDAETGKLLTATNKIRTEALK